ncbi:50S ribosomal protein L21 [Sulfurimonas autotrophica]|jgi:large subunit ribosomal protein L21|uniref:Large ribosomal subunit protein bL21 n=1 Tax=Sulfurimonas autotrophica (strain ATCC BAA-671 / DSM 16294 / JCM 11897 / OK10) TaxID=563040 RepID=E0UQT1_SULAO|nr:50S ribosomal protein L21 [Sulfurimonas autotrophica]ADN08812.1 LSU ribosomal protein L21P [Sulfurimonas autotrophica DSM 16294]
MYAIIKNGGKQYKVQEGDVLSLDKLSLEPEATIEIKEVLAVNAGELKMGAPYVDGAVVTAEVISEGRDKKVVIFKKRRRKDSKVKRGFRRDHTRVRITKIAA